MSIELLFWIAGWLFTFGYCDFRDLSHFRIMLMFPVMMILWPMLFRLRVTHLQMKARTNRVHAPERCAEVDLALAVMCALLSPGQTVSHEIIAEITGLSHFGPQAIEQRALMKLRRKLSTEFRTELVA